MRCGKRYIGGLILLAAIWSLPVAAQQVSTGNSVTVPTPPQNGTGVTALPGNSFDAPPQPAPTLKLPTGLAAEAGSGNLPGQDLAYGSSGVDGQQHLSAAETDSLFASKDFQQSMELYDRPSHGGKPSPAKQFGQAGEAALGNLVILGVVSAIEGHLPDEH
jgi:hypothetical protein